MAKAVVLTACLAALTAAAAPHDGRTVRFWYDKPGNFYGGRNRRHEEA